VDNQRRHVRTQLLLFAKVLTLFQQWKRSQSN
jgi:hypothetical protein